MKYEEYLEEGTISQILDVEKEKYLEFLEKAYLDDKKIVNIVQNHSNRWEVIIAYYVMHDLTKYYLAKKHNLKISGRGVHLATLVALKKVISDKDKKKEIINLIEEAQKIYESLNSPLKEKILSVMLSKARDEREKSQYYISKDDLSESKSEIFIEEIMNPYVNILEDLLK